MAANKILFGFALVILNWVSVTCNHKNLEQYTWEAIDWPLQGSFHEAVNPSIWNFLNYSFWSSRESDTGIREGQEALIIESSCYKHFPTHFLSYAAKSCFFAFLPYSVFKFRTYAETFQMNLTSAVSLHSGNCFILCGFPCHLYAFLPVLIFLRSKNNLLQGQGH